MGRTGTDFMLISSALLAFRGRQCSRFPEQYVAAATIGCQVRYPLLRANTIGRKRLRMLDSVLTCGGGSWKAVEAVLSITETTK
jgi:hypothetical protein